MSFDQTLIDIGRLCAADKAQCGLFAHKLRQLAPELVEHIVARETGRKASEPLPPIADITALECTIFDNWSATGGKRPNKGQKGCRAQRYRASLKAWTVPAATLDFRNPKQCARYQVLLYSEDELAAKAREHQRHGRTEAAQTMDTLLAQGLAKDRLTGIVMARPYGEGTVYHTDQVFLIDDDMTAPSAVLVDFAQAKDFDFPPFDSKDASGRNLMKNALLQSRYSTAPRLDGWRSKPLPPISINRH